MNFDCVKDSGTREHFESGSVRDSREGKGRYDLLSPLAMARMAKHLENGAKKYGDRNWEKGQHMSRYFDSAVRHLYRYLEGHRDEDHLSAAVWNINAMIHTEEMVLRCALPDKFMDMPNYLPKSIGDPS